MKNIIRKLSLKKYDKRIIADMEKHKQYVVVYKNDYVVVNEYTLKDLLLEPKKDIKFIFLWTDRLNIMTEFEEAEEGECSNE